MHRPFRGWVGAALLALLAVPAGDSWAQLPAQIARQLGRLGRTPAVTALSVSRTAPVLAQSGSRVMATATTLTAPGCSPTAGCPIALIPAIDEAAALASGTLTRSVSKAGRAPEQYAAELQALSAALEPHVALSKVQRVVYPMAGDDALTPLQLFPNADTYVLIDSHPFAPSGVFDGRPVELLNTTAHPWVHWQEVGASGHTASTMLPSLRAQYPKLTDLQVNAFETLDAATNTKKVHGILQFRPAPSEPLKTVMVVHADIPTRELTDSWWLSMIRELRPDGVMAKGSQGYLLNASDTSAPTAFAMMLEGLVAAEGGVVVEGMFILDVWEALPTVPRFPHTRVEVDGVPYGYGARLRATQFEPPRRP